MAETAHDFALPTPEGATLDLGAFRGRPLLVVNTASRCGFTPQYAGLEALWAQRRHDGLVVIGVPSDDFRQQPEQGTEIGAVCGARFGVSFPLSARLSVRGEAAHPLFRFLARSGGALARPRWNFYKYLVSRDGALLTWFLPTTRPDATRLQRAVAVALAGPD